MAAQENKTSDLLVRTSVAKTDRIVMLQNPGTANSKTITISVENLFGNTANLQISSLGTPANSNALTVKAGVSWIANGVFYYSDTDNHVKRVAGEDF